MATTKTPLSDQEREQRRIQQREMVTASVEQLRSSAGWRRYLATRQAFRSYSVGNVLLISMQHPTATRVAGFRAWLKLGYCVRKGETGIRIWAPCPPSNQELKAWRDAGADPEQKPRTHWKLAAVFAQDQVDPLPPPSEPASLDEPQTRLAGDSHAALFSGLVAFADTLGYAMRVETDCHGADGYCNRQQRHIGIAAALEPNARVATAVHELAHALVGQADATLTYAQEELVVESIAYCVCDTLGLDTGAASVPYLTSWAESAELSVLEQTATLSDKLARQIEDSLTTIDSAPADASAAAEERGA
jgi:antirestriction protein ArdC